MATYKSIRYNVDYQGNAGSLMPLLTFTSDGSDATADFASKIDSTYKEYLFIYNNIHPETDGANLSIQASTDSGSSYGVTMTASYFKAGHDEADTSADLSYSTGDDIAQSTGFHIFMNTGNDNNQASGGWLRLFNPASTTFVKHFISSSANPTNDDYERSIYCGGYFNTASAIDAIQFKMSSGEIQGGTIQMFGVI